MLNIPALNPIPTAMEANINTAIVTKNLLRNLLLIEVLITVEKNAIGFTLRKRRNIDDIAIPMIIAQSELKTFRLADTLSSLRRK
ncbi:hypothetical protein [Mycoplasma phocoeninasale]|nr:hypothetical protein [Mycoplasma phocoeninasale]